MCIVGRTGAGKSTLLSLLLRLYDPNSGAIRFDGIDIRRLSLASLREQIALVPQDAWMLDGTIADNIAFGRPEATWAEIRRAGMSALVDEFAGRLPAGYQSSTGESGVQLSGGQRRRIAIARAILRDAPLLLLDEPTSGLDVQSEATVLEALHRAAQDRTVITVSHDLRVALAADRIVVLDAGRVVESGPPEQLIRAGGPFQRLWHLKHSDGASPVPETASQTLVTGKEVMRMSGRVRGSARVFSSDDHGDDHGDDDNRRSRSRRSHSKD